MERYNVKPNYGNKNAINIAIGKVLWGKEGKKYSLYRLLIALIKKKREESKNKDEH
jgi:hypothetical protein